MEPPDVTVDPLFDVLDPLVRNQVLTPDQANEVYQAVVQSNLVTVTATTPTAATATATATAATPAPANAVAGRGRWSRARFGAGFGTIGLGLLAAAFLTSYLLALSDLGWNTVIGMVGPILVLALVLVLSEFRPTGGDELRTLAASAGSLALTGLALTVLTTGGYGPLYYVSGFVMLIGGLAGYAAWRRQIFVVPAAAGGLLVVGRLLNDVLSGPRGLNNGDVLTFGALVAGYGLVVVAVGWRYGCRQLAGVFGGGISVVSLSLVIAVNGFNGLFSFRPMGQARVDHRSDIVTALVLGLLVCVVLAAGYAATRDAGFIVVAGLGATLLSLLAALFLVREHPLHLAAILGGVGTLVLAAGAALAWGRSSAAARARNA